MAKIASAPKDWHPTTRSDQTEPIVEARMANSPICSIENCGKPALARGWCSAHYTRWQRHGDPLVRVKRRGEAIAFYQNIVLSYEGDECLIWPFTKSRQGYGWVFINGRGREVHRAACEEIHGPPPTPLHEAAHSCGNGHLACCALKHLRWATQIENQRDKFLHGTVARGEKQGSSKLTESDVRKIRQLRGLSRAKIAELFGVHPVTIIRIQNRTRWSWLD
jgi:hypothetical protein